MPLNGFGDVFFHLNHRTSAVNTQGHCLGNLHLSGRLAVTLSLLSDTGSSWWVLHYCPKARGKASEFLHFKLNCIKYRPSALENFAFYVFSLCYLVTTQYLTFFVSVFHVCLMNDAVRILLVISTLQYPSFVLKKNADALKNFRCLFSLNSWHITLWI